MGNDSREFINFIGSRTAYSGTKNIKNTERGERSFSISAAQNNLRCEIKEKGL